MNQSSENSQVRRSSTRWGQRFIYLLVLIAAVTGIGAIAPKFMAAPTRDKHLTHTVARGSLLVTVTENGTVESSNNKEIKCLVKGGSTVLWVIETGTMVKPGDELIRLDQSIIEDKILQQKIVYENALANKITAESNVAVAEIAITEYLEGTYLEERSKVEKEIFEAEQEVRKSELAYDSAMRLTAKGVFKGLQLEGVKFSVESAKKDLQLKKTRLDSLEKYNREKSLQELRSKLRAEQAKLASYEASLELEKARLDREKHQLENCTIRAETSGMVIFPSMAAWKDTPDIAEGAVVREQQTLLMIPDVSQMQVKVGIHESKVDRLKAGMPAKVQLQELSLDGHVHEIAEVTRPAGWWTGNLVKYDTKIRIDPHAGLKPGMSAIVDIVLAKYDNVLTVPVAAIVEGSDGYYCWTENPKGPVKHSIKIGDTNDEFTVITDGLDEGDEVILSPMTVVEEAQLIALKPSEKNSEKSDEVSKSTKSKASSSATNNAEGAK